MTLLLLDKSMTLGSTGQTGRRGTQDQPRRKHGRDHTVSTITRHQQVYDEEPTKQVADQQKAAKQRISDKKKQEVEEANKLRLSSEEEAERLQYEKLIGQLKAAEARNRVRIRRMRSYSNQTDETNHLVACQTTAASAVRLEALLTDKQAVPDNDAPPSPNSNRVKIDKLSRERIELLMNDDLGLLTMRT